MKIKVNPHYIELVEEETTNEKEINVSDFTFEFSQEITDDFVKEAYFTTFDGNSYKVLIQNNRCNYAGEVLEELGDIEIGVVAYKVDENENTIIRYNPKPIVKYIEYGSLKEAQNSEPITPSDKEQIEQAIQNNTNSINELQDTKVDKVEGKGLSTNDYTNEEKTKLASLENYDDTEIRSLINEKQDQLTAGENITIENNVISATGTTATEWGNITGTLSNQTDLQRALDSKSEFSGNYNDLTNKPDLSGFITKNVNDLTYYTLKTNTGSLIDLEINSSTYVITLSLKNIDGNVISTDTIDLPLESVVVSGSFDSVNKKIVLTLQNGNTVDIPVGDLVAGLQTEITSTNKLNADYVDDSNSGNKFTNTSEKTAWNAKYDKPSGGIPSTDLSSAVQTSLGKADTAIQSETDPVFSASASAGITSSDITNWNNKQNALTFDTTPTSESTNPVTSGGIYIYVNNIVGDINTALDTINGEVVN